MADFYSTLRGVMGLFRIGGADGPQLKRAGTAIEHRNTADNAYVNARGADAVTPDDFVTKRQVSGLSFLEATVIADNAGNWTFTFPTVYPVNAVVVNASVEVDYNLVDPALLPVLRTQLELVPGGIIATVHQGNMYTAGTAAVFGLNQGQGSPLFAGPFRLTPPFLPAQLRFSGSGASDGAVGLDLVIRALTAFT